MPGPTLWNHQRILINVGNMDQIPLPFGLTEPSQLDETKNSFDTATVALATVIAVSVLGPFLHRISLLLRPCVRFFPTLTVPKFTSYET